MTHSVTRLRTCYDHSSLAGIISSGGCALVLLLMIVITDMPRLLAHGIDIATVAAASLRSSCSSVWHCWKSSVLVQ